MLSSNTQAVLLLTCHFDQSDHNNARPLSIKEWGQFAYWLKEQRLTPDILLCGNPEEVLDGWTNSKISTSRLLELLNRGPALGLSVEKWLRSGLWIITRSDVDYPQRLKSHLKFDSPPFLFGCGNPRLLNQGGIAVIGSRNAHEEDLFYSSRLGQLTAAQGYSLISGGARGIDEAAMIGALEAEGTVIGVMADSLLRAISSSKYRRYLQNNNLVLVSPYSPEAGFSAGNAMQRNKYIYCMADAAIAVHSGTSGGTWNGAKENLNKGWSPLWIKPTNDPAAGNHLLVKEGASCIRVSLDQLDLASLIGTSIAAEPCIMNFHQSEPALTTTGLLINTKDVNVNEMPSPTYLAAVDNKPTFEVFSDKSITLIEKTSADQASMDVSSGPIESINNGISHDDFYAIFLEKMSKWCASKALDIGQLENLSRLNKSQLKLWLKQALIDGKISTIKNPIRYRWVDSQQASLFENNN